MSLIKNLRKEKNLTQKELAEQVGVSVWAIRHWEAKRRIPNRIYRQRLSNILGRKPREIIDDIADEEE